MRALALNGSPKSNGNIALMLKEICNGLEQNGHEIETLYLKPLKIADCTGCMACQTKGQCVIRDDIEKVEEALKKADLIIIGTPTHWGNLSGIILRTFERMFGFLIKERANNFPTAQNAKGKKTVLVTACSTSSPFDWIFNQSRSVFSRLNEICQYSGIKIIKKFVFTGTIKRKTISEKYKEKLYHFGLKMQL